MKNILYLSICLWSVIGCSDYVGGDINVDPNKSNQVSLSTLLPTVQEGTSQNHYNLVRFGVGHAANMTNSVFGPIEFLEIDGAWSTGYLKALANADIIIQQAEAQESPYYAGIGKTLTALNLGMLSDVWESIPFSEALDGTSNITPRYDSQEEVYASIFDLLDQAEQDLNAEVSVFSPGSDDLYYAGDLVQWRKLIKSLRARYSLHLINKGGTYAQDVITNANQGILDNADDCQLVYNDRNLNPWHTGVALANNTGNVSLTHSKYLIDLMNGAVYGMEDPRLPFIADKGVNEDYIGLSLNEDDPNYTVDMTEETYHSRADAPILILTAAENYFNLAEAYMALGNTSEAQNAMELGVIANMEKLGVEEEEALDYLLNLMVNISFEGLQLKHIMMQKMIANFLHPEVWTDLRRHNYDTSVYADIEIINQNNTMPLVRIRYPQAEFSRNGAQAQANQKGDHEPMWRDQ